MIYRGADPGGPDETAYPFGLETDMELDDPRTRYPTIARLLNDRTEALATALKEAYDLYDAGESAASAYERGDLAECHRQHERAEGIKERMREALRA